MEVTLTEDQCTKIWRFFKISPQTYVDSTIPTEVHDPDEIREICNSYFEADISGKYNRGVKNVRMKNVAMVLLYETCPQITSTEIANMCGLASHSSVSHAKSAVYNDNISLFHLAKLKRLINGTQAEIKS